MPRRTTLLTAAAAALGASAAATAVGDRLDGFGTRAGEPDRVLPGDELHGPDALVRTRAITVAAPPADVWPWLEQLGRGRAGWGSLDLLLRGDIGFEVVQLDEPRHLVAVYEGDALRLVWALVLRDFDEATRLVARTAFEAAGATASLATRVLVDPGHGVMEVVQLRGVKRRAEGYLVPHATVR